jgi:putative ABC transport system ATP-binding protein
MTNQANGKQNVWLARSASAIETDGLILDGGWRHDLMHWFTDTFLFRGKLRELRQRTADLARIQPGDKLLDVGCGTGTLAIEAQQRVGATGRVFGIDPSTQQIARARSKAARRNLPIDFKIGVIEHLDFADQTFDVVLSTLMMHHLPDDLKRQGLSEIARVLKPGGRLVIADFKRKEERQGLAARFHAGGSGIRDLATHVKDAGFSQVETEEMQGQRLSGFPGAGFVRAYKAPTATPTQAIPARGTLTEKDATGLPIVLQQVGKTYDSPSVSFTALQDISLRIWAGEFVAVVGKSGSGKTTLLNVLAGIDRPTSGTISVAGTPVHSLSESQLAEWRGRTIGLVFQFFQLLPTLTVAENVMLPMDFAKIIPAAERRSRALELLDRVGIREQADKLPASLSGGEQQRAAIARALANDPPILVADEPTGNLDEHTGTSVLELFAKLNADGRTVIVVSHARDISRYASRQVTLVDGRIADDARAEADPQER